MKSGELCCFVIIGCMGVFKCLGDLCESVLFSVGEYVCNSVVVDVKFVIDLIFM